MTDKAVSYDVRGVCLGKPEEGVTSDFGDKIIRALHNRFPSISQPDMYDIGNDDLWVFAENIMLFFAFKTVTLDDGLAWITKVIMYQESTDSMAENFEGCETAESMYWDAVDDYFDLMVAPFLEIVQGVYREV